MRGLSRVHRNLLDGAADAVPVFGRAVRARGGPDVVEGEDHLGLSRSRGRLVISWSRPAALGPMIDL